jgi:hypothetical protein
MFDAALRRRTNGAIVIALSDGITTLKRPAALRSAVTATLPLLIAPILMKLLLLLLLLLLPK